MPSSEYSVSLRKGWLSAMAGNIRSLQALELRLDERLDRFITRYPHMAYPIIFFGMPMLVLTAVFFLTSAVMLPVALIFGWI